VVTARLCCITSKLARTGLAMRVTVRHTPSTATLAPIARPSQKPGGKSMLKLRRPVRSSIAAMTATA